MIKDYYDVTSDGRVYSRYSCKYLVQAANKRGYSQVTLMLADESGSKTFMVHRLVAQKFVPNPNNLPQVNHIDGDKTNNNANNLEWCTNEDNMNHARENGLIPEEHFKTNPPIGEKNQAAVLTENLVIELRNRCLKFSEFVEEYKIPITKACYNQMMRGDTWGHLPNARAHKYRGTRVKKLSKEGELLDEFENAAQAAESVGVSKSAIARCCRGLSSTSCGFKWKYA